MAAFGLAEVVPAAAGMTGEICALGFLLLVVGIFMGNIVSQPVRPERIDRDYVWLRKCSEKFLATLPEAPPI